MKHLEEQLAAYLDGELDPAELAEARAHLHACAKCREALETHKRLSRAFKAIQPEVPSDRMWRNIQSRLGKEEARLSEGRSMWDWLEGWGLTLPRLGMAMAACLGMVLVVMVGFQPPRPMEKQEAVAPQAPAPAKARPQQKDASLKKSKAPAYASLSQRKSATKKGGAMVGAASADARAVESSLALSTSSRHAMRPVRAAEKAGFSNGPYVAESVEPELAPVPLSREAPPPVLPKAEGGVGANGLWDWSYFSRAAAGKQWLDVAAELKAARKQAEAGPERSFAASMIHLFSLPGQPLNSVGLAPESESWSSPDVKLVLIQANKWLLAGDGNSARFSGEVMTRLKGFRTVGPGFTYHFSAGQGIFEPATRFTRLANEPAARVKDQEGKDYLGNEFTIVANAVYDFKKDAVLLKADQGVEP